jgi:drug/metabolite transporter (DMT)-like permease
MIQSRTYLLLVVPPLLWSGNVVFARGLHELLPPYALSFWRWFIALLILLVMTAPQLIRQRQLIREHWKLLGVLGLLGVSSYNTLLYLALQQTTAINAIIINSTLPLHVIWLAALFQRELPSRRQLVAISLSMLGVAAIVLRGDLENFWQLSFNQGDLYMLLAGLSWAVYSLLLRKRPPELDATTGLTVMVALGTLALLPLHLYELTQGRSIPLQFDTVGTVLYAAVFASVIALIIWNHGVEQVGPTVASTFIHLLPLFTTLWAILFLGEQLQSFHLFGAIAIGCGIYLVSVPAGRFLRRQS